MAGLSVRTNLINRRKERHARGQCLNCDNPHRPNRTLCQICADRNIAATKKKKENLKKQIIIALRKLNEPNSKEELQKQQDELEKIEREQGLEAANQERFRRCGLNG